MRPGHTKPGWLSAAPERPFSGRGGETASKASSSPPLVPVCAPRPPPSTAPGPPAVTGRRNRSEASRGGAHCPRAWHVETHVAPCALGHHPIWRKRHGGVGRKGSRAGGGDSPQPHRGLSPRSGAPAGRPALQRLPNVCDPGCRQSRGWSVIGETFPGQPSKAPLSFERPQGWGRTWEQAGSGKHHLK